LDVEAVAGAESYGRERQYGLAGKEAEAELLGDGGESESGFHHGERISDALARAEAEREVGKTRDFFEEVAFPALGEKLFGVIVPARVAMNDPGDGGDAGAFGNRKAGERVIFDGEAGDGPGGRVEAHGFGKDVAGVEESREIVERRSAAVEDGIEFGVQLCFDGRILREEPPGPGERAGGGFVTGEEESESFIAELLRGHA
jgi:hypothetical protein